MSRMTTDVREVEASIMNTLSLLVRDSVNIVTTIFVLLTMSTKLTIIALFLFPIAGLIIGKIGKKALEENRIKDKFKLREFFQPLKKIFLD